MLPMDWISEPKSKFYWLTLRHQSLSFCQTTNLMKLVFFSRKVYSVNRILLQEKSCQLIILKNDWLKLILTYSYKQIKTFFFSLNGLLIKIKIYFKMWTKLFLFIWAQHTEDNSCVNLFCAYSVNQCFRSIPILVKPN